MVAHNIHHIKQGKLLVGLDPERVRLCAFYATLEIRR
jgi:hypothetical protein